MQFRDLPRCLGFIHHLAAHHRLQYLHICDIVLGNLQRIAIEDDEIREFAGFQRACDIIFVQLISSIDGGGSQHRFAREPGIVAQPASELHGRGRDVRTRDANLEGKPLVKRIDGPIAAKYDACACGGQIPRGFENLHALRAKVVRQSHRVARSFPTGTRAPAAH